MRASQMPWSGSCQRRDTASTMSPDQLDRATAPARRAGRRVGQQVGDRAEHVELDLAVGRVADADRAGAGVPGQGLDDRLGAQLETVHCVQRVQPFRVAGGALDDPPGPGQQRLGLLARAEHHQGLRAHRGVAQPAVAVVPVAQAAHLLRQRRGAGGDDRAGRLVAQRPQGQRAAQHQVPAPARAACSELRPVPPRAFALAAARPDVGRRAVPVGGASVRRRRSAARA